MQVSELGSDEDRPVVHDLGLHSGGSRTFDDACRLGFADSGGSGTCDDTVSPSALISKVNGG